MHESEIAQSCPTLSDPHGLQPTRLLHPWDFPGKSTGVGHRWEMQIKSTMSIISYPVGWLEFRKKEGDNNKYWQDVEKLESLYISGRDVK